MNGGTCNGGTCTCLDQFIGEFCGVKNTCYQVDCGPNGSCNNGVCVCDECYEGDSCESYINCCNVDCGVYGQCIEETGKCDFCSATAVGLGDTHYFSFDGRQTDFQGHCSYQLSGLCKNAVLPDNLPNYRLIGRQKQKQEWGIPYVTWLYGWTFEYYPTGTNDKITLKFDLDEGDTIPKMSINDGVYEELLANHHYIEHHILVAGQGRNTIYFGIESRKMAANPNMNFKIKFQWKADHIVLLHLNCDYKKLVCGLMGYFDGNEENDWMLSDGVSQIDKPEGENMPSNTALWKSTYEFGVDYFVPTTAQPTCPDDELYINKVFTCTDEDMKLINSSDFCGKLDTSPFNSCINDVELLKTACAYDLCVVDKSQWEEVLCFILAHHADTCLDAGIFIGNWRTASLCPIQCPVNQIYEENASGCLLTTKNCQPSLEDRCNFPNESRCRCNDDFPYWDEDLQECINYCQPAACIDVNCGNHADCNDQGNCVCHNCWDAETEGGPCETPKNCNSGTCNEDDDSCICNTCFSGDTCDVEDLCCSNKVKCGAFGKCEASTGECDRCTGHSYAWGDTH